MFVICARLLHNDSRAVQLECPDAPGRKTSMRRAAGFTLIELMIVVAIIAILAAIALPSYIRYVQKSRRSDAYAALSQAQVTLERCYAQYFAYNNTACLANPSTSPKNYYAMTSTVNATSFSVTATTQGAQLGDTACQSFTFTSEGIHSAKDASHIDATSVCY
jgi:type IV pilus assembly protein PilE